MAHARSRRLTQPVGNMNKTMVIVGLADKLVRIAWAVLRKNSLSVF